MKIINEIGGLDSSLLKSVPEFERLRLLSQVLLLVIPTLTGFLAMYLILDSYEESSKLPKAMMLFVSLIWALIIFLIDRALFMFPKKKSDTWKKLAVSFSMRLIISLTIGFTISHSLLVYINKGKIDNYWEETLEQKIKDATTIHDIDINNSIAWIAQNENISRQYQNTIDRCRDYISAEETGDKISVAINGVLRHTSGHPNSHKPNALNRNSEDMQITLKDTIKYKNEIQQKIDEQKTKRVLTEDLKEKTINNIKKEYRQDYSVRSEILYKIASKDFLVALHALALFLLIFIADIIPIMLKTFFPFGIYDNLLEKTEEKYEKIFAKWVDDDDTEVQAQYLASLNKIYTQKDTEPLIVTKKIVATGVITGTTVLLGMSWKELWDYGIKLLEILAK